MESAPLTSMCDLFRQFNRLYTRQIGVLDDNLLETPFTLAKSRVLYDSRIGNVRLPANSEPTSAWMRAISAGFRGFRRAGLIDNKDQSTDRRQNQLSS